MRLWTLHPKYLDARGLVALWREALLAKAVLRGRTRGYRRHPQLQRFRDMSRPVAAINQYLVHIHAEAVSRGYAFDGSKVGASGRRLSISVTCGQIDFEWIHLLKKLKRRSPDIYRLRHKIEAPVCNPLFRRKAGPIATWEKGSDA